MVPLINYGHATELNRQAISNTGNTNIKKDMPEIPLNDIDSKSRRIDYLVHNESIKNRTDDLKLPTTQSEVKIKNIEKIYIKDLNTIIVRNNPELQAIKLKIDQSKSLLLESLSLWYPNINLNANGLPQYLGSRQDNNPDFSADTRSQQWKAAISIEVKWNLIDPARIPEIASKRDSYEKARDNYKIKLENLKLEALKRYFEMQRSNENVVVGKQSVEASEINVRDARARFESGIGTKLEILDAEAQLARDRQFLIEKLSNQKINRRSLAEILNLPETINPIAAENSMIIGFWDASLEESIISAYAFREELNGLILDISINNNNANSALAASQPKVSIVNTLTSSYSQGQLAVANPDMSNYGSVISNTVGLNATWNIFDGGKAKARYRYNKEKAEESKVNFTAERLSIRKEVEESFYKLEEANQDIFNAKKELIASKETLRLSKLRFEAGLSTQREVLEKQRDLTKAEVGLTDAITSYNTNLVQLRRRTGRDNIKPCYSMVNIDKKIPNKIKTKAQNLESPYKRISACQIAPIRTEG